jgi:hypothetical protein
MKNLHIIDSYKIWSYSKIKLSILISAKNIYNTNKPCELLNRTYHGMYIEWILHNIGYYITKPLCFFKLFKLINLKCKDVDLEEWKNPSR